MEKKQYKDLLENLNQDKVSAIKMKTLFFTVIFGLVLSTNAFASDDIKTNSYCLGFYQGVNESQPGSGIGREAEAAMKLFQNKVTQSRKLDKKSFESGKSIGLKIWINRSNYKKRPKIVDECFEGYGAYIRTLDEEGIKREIYGDN
ncbi:hypothetical protein [Serratia oryzae]|nr:hypothetical protein [Serratia oryzae]